MPTVYAIKYVQFNFSPSNAAEKNNNIGTIKKYATQLLNHELLSAIQNLIPNISASKKNANNKKTICLFIILFNIRKTKMITRCNHLCN